YGESGGQLGDAGDVVSADGSVRFAVADTRRPIDGLWVHQGTLESGRLEVGQRLTLRIDVERRNATRRNHSATHLLHWALRQVLGPHAQQKGSLVGPERLRFDFTHGQPLQPDQLQRIEELVNQRIQRNGAVEILELPIE